jgi:hypothetical protein
MTEGSISSSAAIADQRARAFAKPATLPAIVRTAHERAGSSSIQPGWWIAPMTDCPRPGFASQPSMARRGAATDHRRRRLDTWGCWLAALFLCSARPHPLPPRLAPMWRPIRARTPGARRDATRCGSHHGLRLPPPAAFKSTRCPHWHQPHHCGGRRCKC